MSVMLTEKAANEVKKIIADQKLDPATVLRVGVAGGGCSGFQYSLGFDTQFDPKADTKSEQHGVAVVVDKKSDLFLDGTETDLRFLDPRNVIVGLLAKGKAKKDLSGFTVQIGRAA